jgi:hypothetical protein
MLKEQEDLVIAKFLKEILRKYLMSQRNKENGLLLI